MFYFGDACLTLKFHGLPPNNHPKNDASKATSRDFRSKAGGAISFLHLFGASVGFFLQDFDPLSLQFLCEVEVGPAGLEKSKLLCFGMIWFGLLS